MLRWKHVSRTLSQNCVVITVHEKLLYTQMQFSGQMLWSPITLDNIKCFDGATTQMIHILLLLPHPRREGIWYLHLHVFSGFFLISASTIMWNVHDGEPATCIKFINSIRNPDRIWGSKYEAKRCLHQFYQIPIKTRIGLGSLVQSDDKIKMNSESQTFHRPSVD